MISLVVPVFDEATRLHRYVPDLLRWASADDHEVVFVDDGSSDGSAPMLDRLMGNDTSVRVLRRPHEGKGAAVSAGIRAASGDVVGFCDLDLSTPLHEMDRVFEAASAAPLLAIASRGLSASDLVVRQRRAREALGKSYNRVVQATLAPGVTDTQCGAKAAHRLVWDPILSHSAEVGFAWDVEVIAIARALGLDVVEIAIRWSHHEGSGVRVIRDGFRMLRAIPRIHARVRSIARNASTRDVFGARNAQTLSEHDETHWWFRSKAAFVSQWFERRDGWLVDLGGGSGGTTTQLGWDPRRVLLTDGNVELTKTAHKRHAVHATVAHVHRTPVRRQSAQVVTLLDVLEHLDEPGAALEEARRILSADGRLVVTVPAHKWLWSDADAVLGHRRRYTRRDLKQLLDNAGFDTEHLTHVFAWLVPPVLLVRRQAGGDAALGLDRDARWIDLSALALTRLEMSLTRVVALPFGTTILAVARVKSDEDAPRHRR